MATEQFYSILTNVGKAKLANSAALGNKVNFSKLKLGDGNGNYYNPSENQTELINKVWEGNIGNVKIDDENSNWVIIETVIPATDGGFYIREGGIFDEEGDLIAISKLAETYKPLASEGSSKDLIVRIILEVSNASSVTLKLDPTVILATKKDIDILQASITNINAQLNDITKKIDNIDLSAEKVKLSGVTGIEATDVKAAIQELFTNASDGQSAVAGEVGIDTKSTWANIKSSILSAKNTIVANLKNKAVNTDNTQSLATLASKIASIPTQAAQTITPGTTNKTITANRFLTGIQTILGDANLIAANIIAGKSIFGVAGSASIESLGGVRIATGTIAIPHVKYFNGNVNLGFTPNVIVIKINVDNQWYDDKGFYNNSSFPVLNTGTSYRMSNRISSDKLAVLVETDRDSGSIRYVVPITNGFYYAAQVSLGAGYYLEYTALRI